MDELDFYKMQGLGNDFVILDRRSGKLSLSAAQIRRIADRRLGVGCDQLLCLEPSERADVFMRDLQRRRLRGRRLRQRHPGGRAADDGGAGRQPGGDRDRGRRADRDRGRAGLQRRHGPAALRLGRDPAGAADGHADRSTSRAARWRGRSRSTSAIRTRCSSSTTSRRCRSPSSGRRSRPIPCSPSAPTSGSPRCGAARSIRLRVWERGAGLTRACGSGACAALVAAVRRDSAERAAEVQPRRRHAADRLERRRPGLDDRPGEPQLQGAAGPGAAGGARCHDRASRGAPRRRRAGGDHLRLPAEYARIRGDAAARPRPQGLDDVVIVHTCAVTAEAERQARQAIRRARRERPEARILVTGCSAQISPRAYAAMAEVDQRGRQRREAAPDALAEPRRPGAEPARVVVDDIMALRETAGHLVEGLGRPHAGLRPGPERLRPPLHVLHHPLRPRPEPERAGGRGGGAGAPPGRGGLPRDRADRGRSDLLRQGPARPADARPARAPPAAPGARAAAAAPVLARPGRDRPRADRARSPRSRG